MNGKRTEGVDLWIGDRGDGVLMWGSSGHVRKREKKMDME